jgi:RHS repeat-associated protein
MKRAAAAFVAACAGLAWSSGALAASGSRTSSFAYDAASGLLTQEVVEPNQTVFRLETDYTYDAFGHKVQTTVVGADIATRSSSAAFDTRGQFATSNTNAINQSETWQYDARSGKPTSHTGPNGLTTTWTYDAFGRKTLEVRPDGTQTQWAYLFCSGINGGTATCIAGAYYIIRSTPLATDGTTQNGPIVTVYMDGFEREMARDSQGFDGSAIRASTQYDAFGRVAQRSRPYFVSGGTAQWTVVTYDALGRAVTETLPDNTKVTHAYHGLVTSDTNALNQTRTVTKNSQGQVVSVIDALNKTTTYAYDPFGNLILTTDAVGNAVTASYDLRGRKTAVNDPDLGAWSYTYDTLSELISQTDAKFQTTTLSYDLLGRMTQRVEPDMTAAWTYDTAAHGIGQLAACSITAGPSAGYQRTYSYDTLTRPVQVAITVGTAIYAISGAYDANGRPSQVTYPSGFAVGYAYTALGYVQQLTNAATGQALWTANARDAELHLTQQTAGNGVATVQSFDAPTGRLTSIVAGTGNAVASFSYTYDAIGNVLSRGDGNTELSEIFVYDQLNRLTSATVAGNVAPAKSFSYDPIGNLLLKSDVGTYTYPAAGEVRPHAVTSISGATIATTFSYDANGNQTSGLGRTLTWTSYNKPASITQGAKTISFLDDMDHQRFQQTEPAGTTTYLDGFGVHVELFTAATTQWNEFLSVGGAMVGVRFNNVTSATVSTRYFNFDHLGSVAVITDETGAVLERLSYDAWGKRRFASGADDITGSISSQTTRGYTGQEQLADVGLVHLNGRVYDPFVGRMLSADPTVPDPTNGQAWNRYSYVINNPLLLTDPTGYSWNPIGAIGDFFTGLGTAFGNLFRKFPILGNIFEIGATAICVSIPVCAPFAPLVAGLTSAFVAGVTTGNLETAVKAGVISAATAVAFNAIGDLTEGLPGATGVNGAHGIPEFGSPAWAFNVSGHAAVGCGSAIASGAKCGPAALAAAVTSAAAPLINGKGFVAGLVANTVLGGVASVAGGGKFANGAVTGAFGYLFNAAGQRFKTPDEAAYDVLQDANPKSIQGNVEYGGTIKIDRQTGEYYATVPNPGNETSAQVCCDPTSDDVGLYHTHGDYSIYDQKTRTVIRTGIASQDAFNSDHFSPTDITVINNLAQMQPGFTGYLGTPSGTFLRYRPGQDPPTGVPLAPP